MFILKPAATREKDKPLLLDPSRSMDKTLKQIIDQALHIGATDVEVYLETTKELFLRVQNQKIENITQSSSKGMGIRIFKEERSVFIYTADFSLDNISDSLKKAIEVVSLMDPDPGDSLPEKKLITEKDLGISDSKFTDTSLQEKTDILLSQEKLALDYDKRIITDYTIYQDAVSEILLANSKDFCHSYKQASGHLHVMALTKGDNIGTEASSFLSTRDWARLSHTDIGAKAARKAIDLISKEILEPKSRTVVFDPELSAEWLTYIGRALNAENIHKGQSFLVGKKGKPIANPHVTLTDDGTIPGQLGTRLFDDEGVPTVKHALINKGELLDYLYNEKYARRENRESTGNCRRSSYKSPGSIGVNNFILQPGSKTPEEIISSVDDGLFLYATTDTGGVNVINGDYSVDAKGRHIKGGKLAEPLNQLTVAGTLPEMLNNIVLIGNDPAWTGNVYSPTIAIKSLMVSS